VADTVADSNVPARPDSGKISEFGPKIGLKRPPDFSNLAAPTVNLKNLFLIVKTGFFCAFKKVVPKVVPKIYNIIHFRSSLTRSIISRITRTRVKSRQIFLSIFFIVYSI
jgi:hypothetical protein